MIKSVKVYVDEKGGGRLYIPQEIRLALGWKDHEVILMKQVDNKLMLLPEKPEDLSELFEGESK
jgi:bifunctional DNA-binding transcriptional regulator/antitoxin component of YhaV-PrlF toxin-antitoxin module